MRVRWIDGSCEWSHLISHRFSIKSNSQDSFFTSHLLIHPIALSALTWSGENFRLPLLSYFSIVAGVAAIPIPIGIKVVEILLLLLLVRNVVMVDFLRSEAAILWRNLLLLLSQSFPLLGSEEHISLRHTLSCLAVLTTMVKIVVDWVLGYWGSSYLVVATMVCEKVVANLPAMLIALWRAIVWANLALLLHVWWIAWWLPLH